ncbi:MAG: hypothetical protein Q9213_000219 [Squamulea squamosa]
MTIPLDFWPVTEITAVERGERLFTIKRNAADEAETLIERLRQHTERFSKGQSDLLQLQRRARFIFSQPNLTEQRGAVDKALENLRSTAKRYEKFAESEYRKSQQKHLKEQYDMLQRQGILLKELDSGLKAYARELHNRLATTSSATGELVSDPPTLRSH